MSRLNLWLLGFLVVGVCFSSLERLTAQEATPAATAAPAPEASAAPVPAEPAAEETPPDPVEVLRGNVNTLWLVIASILVFWMQAGFAMVEAGFTRAKNCCNILMKNLMDFSFGSLAYWILGFGIMFGIGWGDMWSGLFGVTDFFYDPTGGKYPVSNAAGERFGFFFFQLVFAGTAATIVSGAMAERTKFTAYVVASVFMTALIYPVYGHWAWGSFGHGDASKGWLEQIGFLDFAGSTVVHSIGGWAALAGTLALGPRIGKYFKGRVNAIPGHNLSLAALGVFILWFGWFGFNPGSTGNVTDNLFAYIAVTTNLAAASGAVSGTLTSWRMFGKPDPSFAFNGTLAGLVAITAGCNVVTPAGAIVIGLLAGVLVVVSCVLWDMLGVDDPVGAVSVHGVCGVWGTLAVGLFATEKGLFYGHGFGQLGAQFLGALSAFAWSFALSYLMFHTVKLNFGLRVTEAEEVEGLDVHEHGMLAYPAHWVTEVSAPNYASQAASYRPTSGTLH